MAKVNSILAIIAILLYSIKAEDNNDDNKISENGDSEKTASIQRQGFGTCFPASVLNGQINYLQTNPSIPYSQGTTAILNCNIGFTVGGSSNSQCTNSNWSPPLGTCNGNGQFGSSTFGSFGSNPFTTVPFGGGGPNCLGMLPPLSGRLTYTQGGLFGPYPSGTSVQLICDNGFPQGQTSAFCNQGAWQPPVLGTCSLNGIGGNTLNPFSSTGGIGGGLGCPAPLPPINGNIIYSGQVNLGTYPSGSSASLTCNPGTYVSGTTTTYCQNGQWNPPLGTCSAGGIGGIGTQFGSRTCALPMMTPLGGQINYSQQGLGGYPDGTTASLVCNGGFPTGSYKFLVNYFTGVSMAFCTNGQWQPNMFTGCSNSNGLGGSTNGFGISNGFGVTNGFGSTNGIGQCTMPINTVINGQINYSNGALFAPFPSNTIASLMCQNGQLPTGPTSSTCLNGFWQPANLGPCGNNNFG